MLVKTGAPVSPQALLADMAAEIELAMGVGVGEREPASPLWEPLPGPQTDALTSPADELYFGGAAGGGKTDLLLGLALTQHHSSIVFRRQFTQLRGAEGIIERSKQIIGLHGKLNEGIFIWRDLPGGRSLEFGGVDKEQDKLKYQGRPHDLKGFDELPQFTETQYRFLVGWLRTTIVGQRTRVVSTGNPPTTPEGEWVIRYWAPWLDGQHPNPAAPGELRWFAYVDGRDVEVEGPEPIARDGEPVYPRSRTFIPSRVENNPYYMRTGYVHILNALPEPLRSQLRYGDFGATQDDDPWQVIPTAWVRAAQQRWTRDGGDGRRPSRYGVDPSRGGTAQFVIAEARGRWVAPLVKHPAEAAPTGQAGAALVHHAVGGDRGVPIQVDVIGTAGGSVYDHCVGLGLQAVAMNGSEQSAATDRSGRLGFVNKRAEWHWLLREALEPGSGQDLALPPDPQLLADLCAPRWKATPRGVQVEPKEHIVARLGRSPDCGEAVIYALAQERPKKRIKGALW